uniref:Uncharacterized protein n=1 Tax=Yoonia rhodophyticola TaxID=3137370 RepID=A0AAN0NKL8_9RHOB
MIKAVPSGAAFFVAGDQPVLTILRHARWLLASLAKLAPYVINKMGE